MSPYGIPVTFAISGGTGGFLLLPRDITVGANTTWFTLAGVGTRTSRLTVDLQNVTVPVTVNSTETPITAWVSPDQWT